MSIVTEVLPPKYTAKGWRWDVVVYLTDDSLHPGVFDVRIHVERAAGYTKTKWGAWRKVHKAVSLFSRE